MPECKSEFLVAVLTMLMILFLDELSLLLAFGWTVTTWIWVKFYILYLNLKDGHVSSLSLEFTLHDSFLGKDSMLGEAFVSVHGQVWRTRHRTLTRSCTPHSHCLSLLLCHSGEASCHVVSSSTERPMWGCPWSTASRNWVPQSHSHEKLNPSNNCMSEHGRAHFSSPASRWL